MRYKYYCTDCDEEFDVYNVKMDDRNVLQVHEECGSDVCDRVWEPCKNVLKASWPDGYRKQNHADWQTMRAYQKLRLKKLNTPDSNVEEKIEIAKEMDSLADSHKPRYEAPMYDGSINDAAKDEWVSCKTGKKINRPSKRKKKKRA